jgi:phosphoribosylamine--glycine ligase
MSERILLLGSGGREHALALALRQSASCQQLWCAPGNPGIWSVAERVDIPATDAAGLLAWCREHQPTLVVIGPEQPLAMGVSDTLRAGGFAVFGPSQAAAQLETSKGFAKEFMRRHNIPTAPFARFTDRDEALAYLAEHHAPIVIKYDGLAAGKGVVVAMTQDDAVGAVNNMFDGAFGTDGVVIEGFLEGVEASIFAVTDGHRFETLAPSHDYKRIGNAGTGKNTGGMGAVAPSPRVLPHVLARVRKRIIEPTLWAMEAEGMPFVGCLYVGVMIDAAGSPFVVEFNARFGDPETQGVMGVLKADVAALFASAARGALDPHTIDKLSQGAATCVVLASGGYPDAYETGFVVNGIDAAESIDQVTVYHAGTALGADGSLVTSGGRVLGVTATAATIPQAMERAYEAAALIDFQGKYHRTDIGKNA